MIGPPPESPAPPALFRAVLAGALPIKYRIVGAESIALSVRAPSMIVSANILPLLANPGLEWIDGMLLLETLIANGAPAFRSIEQIGCLSIDEAATLGREAWQMLKVCAPTYAGSDVMAWERVIAEGAKHPTNWTIMHTLGRSGGPDTIAPEQWFGKPISELSDGQIMVFNVCRAIYIERVNEEYARRRANAPR